MVAQGSAGIVGADQTAPARFRQVRNRPVDGAGGEVGAADHIAQERQSHVGMRLGGAVTLEMERTKVTGRCE